MKKEPEVHDGTCQGPGSAQGRCGKPAEAQGLCATHYQQWRRGGQDRSKLKPIVKKKEVLPEARGKISRAAAELVAEYGKAQLAQEPVGRVKNPLWRGTQLVLEAFARGDLVWRKGAQRPLLAQDSGAAASQKKRTKTARAPTA